jgi:hypothetical protein
MGFGHSGGGICAGALRVRSNPTVAARSKRLAADHLLLAPFLLLAASAFLFGCAGRGDDLEKRAEVSYYDRNGDGKVDLEKHQHAGVADADWELRARHARKASLLLSRLLRMIESSLLMQTGPV